MDQSAAPAAPRTGAAAGRATAPALDPSVRFYQPLLADWTPKSLDPHTENVEVYTNAQEVELFLNGKSLGTEKLHTDASPITYQVPFAAGELKAVARNEGKEVASSVLKTAGKPARIALSADSPDQPLTPDWNDVRYVTATLVDASGTRIPDSATLVHFSASGPASVIAVDSGNMMDHEPFQAAQRKLYDGNVTALLRATGSAGKVTITAAADGVAPGMITLEAGPLAREDRNIAHPAAEERGF
jgi:beta-galactosidase